MLVKKAQRWFNSYLELKVASGLLNQLSESLESDRPQKQGHVSDLRPADGSWRDRLCSFVYFQADCLAVLWGTVSFLQKLGLWDMKPLTQTHMKQWLVNLANNSSLVGWET